MSGFSAIDLTKLTAPNIVETLAYEDIFQAMRADLIARHATFSALLDSDPVIKILQVAAYREVLLRARINDASKAVMLAYAQSTDLDHLAAYFGVKRQVIDPGDANAIPPRPPIFESDQRLQKRTQLSLEGHSTAGPVGSYIFHALAASPDVKDVDVVSPQPGLVDVTVLSTVGSGVPSDALIEAVNLKLNAKHIRPLTDFVTVKKAEIIDYHIVADMMLYEGPDADVVLHTAQHRANEFVDRHHLLGNDINLSGIYAALHQEGVQKVTLLAPLVNLIVLPHQAAWCTDISLTVRGRDE